MKNNWLKLLFLALLFSCSPENEKKNVKEIADTTKVAKVVDSVKLNSEKDGTLVQENEKDDRRTLPEKLEPVLDSLHPGWKLPLINKAFSQQAVAQSQGPYFISGYFNADDLEDFVIQIHEKGKIKVLAYLNSENGLKEYQVTETKALPNRTTGQSLFVLAPASDPDVAKRRSFTLKLPETSTTYVFRNEKFIAEPGK